MFTNLSLIPDSSSDHGYAEDYSCSASSSDTSIDELTEFLVNSNAIFTETVTNYYYLSDDDTGIQEPAAKKKQH
jgi:hypothetical protein